MSPFCNLLKRDDVVLHSETKRVGKVVFTPVETSARVGVEWQGTKSTQYVDVVLLRLVVNGKPEEVPPIEGEPPGPGEAPVLRRPNARAPEPSAIAVLKKERDDVDSEMRRIEGRFKELRAIKERLERAILVLTAPPLPAQP